MRAASSSSRCCFSGVPARSRIVLPEAGAEAIDVEAGDLRRRDDRAFRNGELLIRRSLRGGQQADEQSKCSHAAGKSKE